MSDSIMSMNTLDRWCWSTFHDIQPRSRIWVICQGFFYLFKIICHLSRRRQLLKLHCFSAVGLTLGRSFLSSTKYFEHPHSPLIVLRLEKGNSITRSRCPVQPAPSFVRSLLRRSSMVSCTSVVWCFGNDPSAASQNKVYYTFNPPVSDHPKCKDWVVAHGRWSLTRIEPQGGLFQE